MPFDQHRPINERGQVVLSQLERLAQQSADRIVSYPEGTSYQSAIGQTVIASPGGAGGGATTAKIIRVTSLTQVGSYYRCVLESWSGPGEPTTAGTWSDGASAFFLPANGETPVVGHRYGPCLDVDTASAPDPTQAVIATANVTAGSNALENLTNQSGLTIGMVISGPGIPAGTTLQSLDATNLAATMSQAATVTGTSIALTFAPIVSLTVYAEDFSTSLSSSTQIIACSYVLRPTSFSPGGIQSFGWPVQVLDTGNFTSIILIRTAGIYRMDFWANVSGPTLTWPVGPIITISVFLNGGANIEGAIFEPTITNGVIAQKYLAHSTLLYFSPFSSYPQQISGFLGVVAQQSITLSSGMAITRLANPNGTVIN